MFPAILSKAKDIQSRRTDTKGVRDALPSVLVCIKCIS
jgi:hypothetical protein